MKLLNNISIICNWVSYFSSHVCA